MAIKGGALVQSWTVYLKLHQNITYSQFGKAGLKEYGHAFVDDKDKGNKIRIQIRWSLGNVSRGRKPHASNRNLHI